MRKILLVLDDKTVNIREILTEEVRAGLLVLDRECKEQGIQITPEMVSEIIGHKVVEAKELPHNPFEELLKNMSPYAVDMIPQIKESDYDIEPKPPKKIPRKQRYNSPDWNF
jgi:hypothetical protein